MTEILKMTCQVLSPILMDDREYEVGETIELPDDVARTMEKAGRVAVDWDGDGEPDPTTIEDRVEVAIVALTQSPREQRLAFFAAVLSDETMRAELKEAADQVTGNILPFPGTRTQSTTAKEDPAAGASKEAGGGDPDRADGNPTPDTDDPARKDGKEAGGGESLREQKILAAMAKLDPEKESDFTKSGKPQVDVLEEWTLLTDITAAERDELWAKWQASQDG